MRILLAAVLLAAFLAGCGSSHVTDELGITPVTFPNGMRINAETMRTDIELLKGLMFRDSLPDDRGMLFVFEQPKAASFWMRNTKIPLSIAYLDSTGKILEIESMKPLDETVVPSVSDQVAYALEVNQGWFGRHGIAPGAKIDGIPRK